MRLLLIGFIATSSLNAFALNLQSYKFSDSYRYSVVDDSYKDKFKGNYLLTSSLGFTNSPFYVADEDVTKLESEIIRHQSIFTLGGTYYLNNHLTLGIDLNALHSNVLGESHTTMGDTIIKARYNLLRSTSYSFSINPKLYLPTGRNNNFSTTNSLAGSLSGVGEYRFSDFHFLGSLGYFHGPDNKYSIVDYRNLVLLTVAASYDLSQDWSINGEAVKNFTTNRSYRQDEGDYYLTFKYKAHQMVGVFFGAGIAGLDEIDRNNYTIFAGIKVFNF
jgi:hypothetical protein